MSKKSGSTATHAGLVEVFRQMQENADWSSGSDSVQSVFEDSFQKLNTGTTLVALSQLTSIPEGTGRIIALFLEYCDQSPTDTTSGIDSHTAIGLALTSQENQYILDGTPLKVSWQPAPATWKPRALPQQTIQRSWEGTCNKEAFAHIVEINHPTEGRLYQWDTHLGTTKKEGMTLSRQDAANAIYVELMAHHTKVKFTVANLPVVGKEVRLYGKWIKAENHKPWHTIVPGATDDSRDDAMFVMGHQSLFKDSVVVKIEKVHKVGRYVGTGSMDLHVTAGGVDLEATLDWCIAYPEKYVEGQCLCRGPVCRGRHGNGFTIANAVTLAMRFVPGVGPMCGLCIDALIGDEGIDVPLAD